MIKTIKEILLITIPFLVYVFVFFNSIESYFGPETFYQNIIMMIIHVILVSGLYDLTYRIISK